MENTDRHGLFRPLLEERRTLLLGPPKKAATISGMNLSPMMKQYEDAKAASGDAILFFRMGDFYELFHEDAKTAARVLGLTLTSRDKGENPIPMAGFPHHQLEGYLAKLVKAGFRVAVCEQMEDPAQAKGLVRREVQRIVTAGTLTDEALLDPRAMNLLLSVFHPAPGKESSGWVGLAWVELSTGRFEAGAFPKNQLRDQIARIEPAEILTRDDDGTLSRDDLESWALTRRPSWQFGFQESQRILHEHFGVLDLTGMGWDLALDGQESSAKHHDLLAICAAGAALAYLQETQKSSLNHIRQLVPTRLTRSLEIDMSTRRSLELTQTIRSASREGSLLDILDRTITSMGARRLSQWLASPLIHREQIELRLGAVGEFVTNDRLRQTMRQHLGEVYDIERLTARVATGRCSPRDLRQVGRSLSELPRIKALLEQRQSSRIQQLQERLDLQSSLREHLESALEDDCPLVAKDGGFIKSGYDQRLDDLRQLATGGKEWIAQYQADQIQQTGITSLKVGFTSVFGYYLEITNTHKDRIPANYIRKQTLKNAERYITPELKEYEEKVLSADDSAKALEYELFLELRQKVHEQTQALQVNAAILAELDVYGSLAELAVKQGYVKPTITEEPILEIYEGRHPVLDCTMAKGTFVPNDAMIGAEHGSILLITGPNMAGKSTYIRQTALLTILAQMGSYVPARKATIGIADRLFARVGASDELARGQSTFMVEMVETARILNTATDRSLVILDEIGRGTSTYDGLSLAWAIVEHLHGCNRARTMFATHYHELIELQNSLPGVRNWNVSVKEWDDNVVFLHRIVPGGADRSYGIHVARLAGVPREVNDRAKEILLQLEANNLDKYGQSKIAKPKKPVNGTIQMTLFEWKDNAMVDELKALSLDQMTPIEAWQKLEELHHRAKTS
jgi:DNA mismatch repair protein MutS